MKLKLRIRKGTFTARRASAMFANVYLEMNQREAKLELLYKHISTLGNSGLLNL